MDPKVIRDAFRREMNDLADTVATGGCASWDEYMKITGVIEGIARAERIFLDIVDGKLVSDDD